MADLHQTLTTLNCSGDIEKTNLIETIRREINQAGYKIVDEDTAKPWGAYFRFSSDRAEAFVNEFFPDLSLEDAQLGVPNAELSPKILIFSPGQRLSWQYHYRRAERWKFLTPGYYVRSTDNEEGPVQQAVADEVVQFKKGERHRGGAFHDFTIVAEIWQHTDLKELSNEADIVRVSDDYSRS